MNDLLLNIINYIEDPDFLENLFNNRFILIFLVISLMHLKYASYKNIYIAGLINIPGTTLHELCHYFVGAILNAQPTSFSIFPKKDEYGNYVMGSVGFRNVTFYNALPSAMAPLFLLPIGFWINRYFLPNLVPTLGNYLLYIFLQTVIIENALPSKQDFRVAFISVKGILFFALIAGIIFMILN